jgi:predicted secreted protein
VSLTSTVASTTATLPHSISNQQQSTKNSNYSNNNNNNNTMWQADKEKREAEKIISEATVAVGEFRSWLTSAISESERLYRIQTQSLNAAEQAIGETRSRLKQAFERLAALQGDIDANIDIDNRPVGKTFVRNGGKVSADSESKPASEVKSPATSPARKVAKKSTTKKRK